MITLILNRKIVIFKVVGGGATPPSIDVNKLVKTPAILLTPRELRYTASYSLLVCPSLGWGLPYQLHVDVVYCRGSYILCQLFKFRLITF